MTSNNPDPGATAPQGAGGTETQTPSGGESKHFTQAELDAILQDRLNRERKKYEGFDDLKAKAEQFDALQEQNKTELQRERESREKLEKELERERAVTKQERVAQRIEREAAKKGFIDPEDVAVLLDKSLIEEDDDGAIKPKSLEKALADLAERKPHLVRGLKGGSYDAGPRGRTPTTDPDELFGRLVAEKAG